MKVNYNTNQYYSNVAFATFAIIIATCIDATEQQQNMKLENKTNMNEIQGNNETSTILSNINWNVNTNNNTNNSNNNNINKMEIMAIKLNSGISSQSTTSSSTADEEETDYTEVIYSTLRPLIIPTLPEFRRRVSQQRPYQSKHHHEHHWGPFFEEPANVTAGAVIQIGFHLATDAVLNCRVGMLKDKTVMWLRKTIDKVSLLTVGNTTYSGDPRINVKFQYPNNWRLHIAAIKAEDAGVYLCQVSTHPPRVITTNLTVLEPAIRVVDELGHEVNDRYYKLGSSIDITCQVAISFLSTLSPMPAFSQSNFNNSLFISKDVNNINENLGKNTITGKNKNLNNNNNNKEYNNKDNKNNYLNYKIIWKKDNENLPNDVIINYSNSKNWYNSRLKILHADRTHSGAYYCSVSNTTTAVVHVQVLNGETPAAVQHNGCGRGGEFNDNKLLYSLVFLIISFSIRHISCY